MAKVGIRQQKMAIISVFLLHRPTLFFTRVQFGKKFSKNS